MVGQTRHSQAFDAQKKYVLVVSGFLNSIHIHGMVNLNEKLKSWARSVKRDGLTLWFAGKSPQTPWYAKALGALVVAYALSPIDLIPDFIPVLGYVDDVLLLPALIWLTIRLLPEDVRADCRRQAEEWLSVAAARPSSKIGAVAIIVLWLAVGVVAWCYLRPDR